jgi:hypothetical protein
MKPWLDSPGSLPDAETGSWRATGRPPRSALGRALGPAQVLALQRTAGNRAVTALCARLRAVGPGVGLLQRGPQDSLIVEHAKEEARIHAEIEGMVARLQHEGLPVKFLTTTLANLDVEMTDDAKPRYSPFWERLYVPESSVTAVPGGMAPNPTFVYHESTHAFFDVHRKDPKVRELIDEGRRYYEHAPVRNSSQTEDLSIPTTDPDRVFQEAAAEYVANRIDTWWTAAQGLVRLAQRSKKGLGFPVRNNPAGNFIQDAVDLRLDYDKGMARKDFGYGVGRRDAYITSDRR